MCPGSCWELSSYELEGLKVCLKVLYGRLVAYTAAKCSQAHLLVVRINEILHFFLAGPRKRAYETNFMRTSYPYKHTQAGKSDGTTLHVAQQKEVHTISQVLKPSSALLRSAREPSQKQKHVDMLFLPCNRIQFSLHVVLKVA